MNKNTIFQLPFLLLEPRKYFKEIISINTYTIKELLLVCLAIIGTRTILEISQPNFIESYDSVFTLSIHLLGFILGMAISISFRTYLISIILKKMLVEFDYRKIGMIVGLALLPNILLSTIPLILNTISLNETINTIAQIWNIVLVLIGLVTVFQIAWSRGFIIIFILIGIELIFKMLMFSI